MYQAFGIDKEIMMIFSDYDRIEPRALQAADMLFDVFPFKNRVDSLNFFCCFERQINS